MCTAGKVHPLFAFFSSSPHGHVSNQEQEQEQEQEVDRPHRTREGLDPLSVNDGLSVPVLRRPACFSIYTYTYLTFSSWLKMILIVICLPNSVSFIAPGSS